MRGSAGRTRLTGGPRTRSAGPAAAAVALTLALAACGGSGTSQTAGGGATTTGGGSAGAAGDAGGGGAGSATGGTGPGGALGAATGQAAGQPAGQPAGGPTATARPTGLDGFDFLNYTYDLGPDLGQFKMVNGEYQKGKPGDVEFVEAQVVRVATGDLTADGQADAAVTFYFTTGGTGQFTDVFVYRFDGKGPALVGRDGVGDRADDGVRWADIAQGRLLIDRYQGQGACCPEQVVRREVTVQGTKLASRDKGTTFALVTLDFDGVDASKAKAVKFLPGTSTGILESGIPTPPAVLDARQGQHLTLQVEETNRLLHFAPLELVQNGAVIGTAKAGAPLTLTLPATGTYEIRPVTDRTAGNDLLVSAELSITG